MRAFVPVILPLVFSPRCPVSPSPKLIAELVLQTCWFSHVRDHISTVQWDRLRKQTSHQAHDRCEICGERGHDCPFACHDVWQNDETTDVQMLVRLIAFCPACHAMKHLGLAQRNGHLTEARVHFSHVNTWTDVETVTSLTHVWTEWENRRQRPCTVDLSWVEVLPRSCRPNANTGI